MPIPPEARRQLLDHARAAIRCRLAGKALPECPENPQSVSEKVGAFVSLHTREGNLRGCIGTFTADEPLHRTVRDMAISAAFHDPRFPPVAPGDLDNLNIEISVLSPMKDIKDPSEIVIGEHGLYITAGSYRGVLLPQVATRQEWTTQTFLEETCRKAGLSRDRWKDPDVKISVFSAEVLAESPQDR